MKELVRESIISELLEQIKDAKRHRELLDDFIDLAWQRIDEIKEQKEEIGQAILPKG